MKSNSHDDLLDGSDGEEEEKIDPRTLMPGSSPILMTYL
jgi:hypothetical protein